MFFEDVTKTVDEASLVDVFYLDVLRSSAVSRQRLLLNLKALGIGNGRIDSIEKNDLVIKDNE